MLNFDNVRKMTQEMRSEAFAYTEAFLQNVFDYVSYDKSFPFEDRIMFAPAAISTDDFLDDTITRELFKDIHLEVIFDCFGKLYVNIGTSDEGEAPEITNIYRNIKDVLLQNGFAEFSEGQFIHTV